jgi:hypothetical protein
LKKGEEEILISSDIGSFSTIKGDADDLNKKSEMGYVKYLQKQQVKES